MVRFQAGPVPPYPFLPGVSPVVKLRNLRDESNARQQEQGDLYIAHIVSNSPYCA